MTWPPDPNPAQGGWGHRTWGPRRGWPELGQAQSGLLLLGAQPSPGRNGSRWFCAGRGGRFFPEPCSAWAALQPAWRPSAAGTPPWDMQAGKATHSPPSPRTAHPPRAAGSLPCGDGRHGRMGDRLHRWGLGHSTCTLRPEEGPQQALRPRARTCATLGPQPPRDASEHPGLHVRPQGPQHRSWAHPHTTAFRAGPWGDAPGPAGGQCKGSGGRVRGFDQAPGERKGAALRTRSSWTAHQQGCGGLAAMGGALLCGPALASSCALGEAAPS